MAALPQQGAAPLAPLTRLSLHTHKNSIPAFGVCTIFAGFHFIREVIPIAIYHCNISIVSRGKGKSAVAAAAYRSGEKLTNEWDGMTHDYTRKGGVVHTEIMLPPHAPPSFSDRSTLWNSVELYEKAGNAQLAREIDAALPIELSREEQIRLVREYCSSQFVSRGMCVDYAIHDTGKGNPHCHIMLDREGKVVKEEKEITVPAFKVITVFDISQTEGKEFPDLSVKPLLADVEQYEDFFAALEKASPVPIAFEQITNGANGYFSLTDKRIAIKEGVSELQAVKTAIHEIAHAKLHDVDLNAPPEQQNRVDRHTCEVEAESVAYTVCQHFGLDTSDYSFGYVAGWSSGKEMTELKASLETIQTTAKELITEIEGHFTELQQQRQAEQEQGDTFSIYQLKRGDETRDLRFEPYDRLQAAGLTIDRVNYELVYTAPLTKDMTLGDIWERFNIDHPADFKGHSLSVSDIVVLHQNDEDTAHYVDSIGFQQVPEFLQEQQTPVFDKLPPEQQQALSDTVQDTLQMLVDADKRIYGDVTGKTLEAIAAQGYSYKDGQLEKQQPEATPDSLLTGETVRTPRGNFHITDMSREQIEAAGFGFHHASEDGKYLIMGNGTQAYAIAAEQPQRDNPLKHVEDTIEQNDNNFDGLINNTPQTPTVADFEQRAKAGEAISVTDLAKAVKAEKREQPQKKPSILKKLDEYKKQAAQQPKDKQKEHKKDLEV